MFSAVKIHRREHEIKEFTQGLLIKMKSIYPLPFPLPFPLPLLWPTALPG